MRTSDGIHQKLPKTRATVSNSRAAMQAVDGGFIPGGRGRSPAAPQQDGRAIERVKPGLRDGHGQSVGRVGLNTRHTRLAIDGCGCV